MDYEITLVQFFDSEKSPQAQDAHVRFLANGRKAWAVIPIPNDIIGQDDFVNQIIDAYCKGFAERHARNS